MNSPFKQSIRKRISRTFVLFTLAVTIIFAGIGLVALFVAEDKVIDQLLDANARWLKETYDRSGQVMARDHHLVRVYRPEDLPPNLAPLIQHRARGEIALKNQHFHFLRLDLDAQNTRFLVAEVSGLLSSTAMQGDFFTLLALGLFLSSFVALLVAYRLAKRLSQPTMNLAQQVIGQCQAHSIQIYPQSEESELDYLAAVIERSLFQLSDLLERERNFNKDVSHELRTPLTIIRNQLALNVHGALSTKDINIIEDAALDIETIVSALLALARSESQQLEKFNLIACIEQTLIDREAYLGHLTVNFTPTQSSHQVVGKKAIVQLVLINLFENAAKYSPDGSLTIHYEGDWVCFTNGVPEYSKEPSGLGRGLYLVERMLETLGWKVQVSRANQYFRVAILPRTS